MASQLNSMPSKKNKARGKARRAAKSRKAREDGAVNDINSEMQRLQISNNKNSRDKDDDEEALLEEAINLAAAEKEVLKAAARNDKENNSAICRHGNESLPGYQVCSAFMKSFVDEWNACLGGTMRINVVFGNIHEATKTKFYEVWNDPEKLRWIASRLITRGTNMILEGDCRRAGFNAMCSSFFEQWAAIRMYQNETQASCGWQYFRAFCDWTKMSELYYGDEHTLVSFFRKQIPCKCLDNKYKEVKSITKIGFCHNANCSIPDNKAVRSKMFQCTQCRKANYCSRECQVAEWPTHKQFCVVRANISAARKSTQKE